MRDTYAGSTIQGRVLQRVARVGDDQFFSWRDQRLARDDVPSYVRTEVDHGRRVTTDVPTYRDFFDLHYETRLDAKEVLPSHEALGPKSTSMAMPSGRDRASATPTIELDSPLRNGQRRPKTSTS